MKYHRGITGTVVDSRLIVVAEYKAYAVSLMLAHNHRSGDVKPANGMKN